MKGLWFYVQNYKTRFCSVSSKMTKYCPLENLSLCTCHFRSLPQFSELSFTWEWTEPCWNSVHHLGRFVSWIASFSLLSHSFRKQKCFQKQAARFSYSHQLKGHFFFNSNLTESRQNRAATLRPFLMCVTAYGDWGGASEVRICEVGNLERREVMETE